MKRGDRHTYNGIQASRRGQECEVITADKETAGVKFDDGFKMLVARSALERLA